MRLTGAGILVMAALGAALAAPAAADTTLTVGKAAANASPIVPVNVGDRLGIFKRHGLTLQISDFTGGSKLAQAITAGAVDIGVGAGTEMALAAKGAPMLAVCNNVPPVTFIGIAVPWDSPIEDVAGLKGKLIGVSSSGSLTDWLARELARHEGWGADGVRRVAIGNGTASVIAAFRAHTVDADVAVTSLIFAMEEKREGKLLVPASSYEGNLAAGTIFAADRLIQTNPAAIRAFIAGWLDTIAYMRGHKAETVKIEAEVNGFSEAVMAKEYDLTIGMFSKDCKFDAQSLATLERSFVELKIFDKPPDMTKLYTEKFLPR